MRQRLHQVRQWRDDNMLDVLPPKGRPIELERLHSKDPGKGRRLMQRSADNEPQAAADQWKRSRQLPCPAPAQRLVAAGLHSVLAQCAKNGETLVLSRRARPQSDEVIRQRFVKRYGLSSDMNYEDASEWFLPAIRRSYARLAAWMTRENRVSEPSRLPIPTRVERPSRVPEKSRQPAPPPP
jgi:hypothetical protein